VRSGNKGKLQYGGSPLGFRPEATDEVGRFAAFCDEYLIVPKGTGARGTFRPRPWQLDIVGDIVSGARTAGVMMPRGQGKTTLIAAVALYRFFTGGEGANTEVVAVDERQAGLAFGVARRMVELSEPLKTRCYVYADKLILPRTDSTFQVRPASPAALEGLDYVTAIVDEAGVVTRDVFETVQLAQGKRESSVLVAIGTPGPDPFNSVLNDLRSYHLDNPDDTTLRFREYSAHGFEDHPADCEHCWKLANPALDDFLHRDAIRALLPPKTRESTFRRARLCQYATDTEGSFLPAGTWDTLDAGHGIDQGETVVVALDGSFSDDTTALLAATVSTTPHVDVLGVWERPAGDDGSYRVPVAEVEQAIRDACRHYDVAEIVADPFRWTRTLQALESERLPVVEFPHSPSRLTAATGDLYSACINGRLTHSGDRRLAEHVAAAIITEDVRGIRLAKKNRTRTARKIDLAACLVMAYSRATWRATKKTRKRTRSFA